MSPYLGSWEVGSDGITITMHSPWSARAGLEWWQLDKAWLIIRFFEALKIVWSVKEPTDQQKKDKHLEEEQVAAAA
ncbi:MAG: hypothetical protein AAF558_07685 [Verrucomicrobiota bacterium]